MKKIAKYIEIVRSTKPGLNSLGTKSSNALHSFLESRYEKVGVSIVNDADDLEVLVAKRPDLVFIGMKYVTDSSSGTKIWITDYLQQHGINHTGSTRPAIEIEQDKSLAKQSVMTAGFNSSPFVVVRQDQVEQDLADISFPFPLFVKPVGLGAGHGIDEHSVARNPIELQSKVQSLSTEFGADALVETYLSGREFSVAVIKDEATQELIAMPLELLPGADKNGDFMLSHRLKSGALETPVVPVTDEVLRATLMDLAVGAFKAIGARDYGRIDIRLDAHGTPHFLEANLIPCIIEGSGNFLKASLLNRNMGYDEMILRIVNLAFAHEEMPRESSDSVSLPAYPLIAQLQTV